MRNLRIFLFSLRCFFSLFLEETGPLWNKATWQIITFLYLVWLHTTMEKGKSVLGSSTLSNYISWLQYQTLSNLIWSCMSTWLTQMKYRDTWSLNHYFTKATKVHNPPSKQDLLYWVKTQCTKFRSLSCITLPFISGGTYSACHEASILNRWKHKDTVLRHV